MEKKKKKSEYNTPVKTETGFRAYSPFLFNISVKKKA